MNQDYYKHGVQEPIFAWHGTLQAISKTIETSLRLSSAEKLEKLQEAIVSQKIEKVQAFLGSIQEESHLWDAYRAVVDSLTALKIEIEKVEVRILADKNSSSVEIDLK